MGPLSPRLVSVLECVFFACCDLSSACQWLHLTASSSVVFLWDVTFSHLLHTYSSHHNRTLEYGKRCWLIKWGSQTDRWWIPPTALMIFWQKLVVFWLNNKKKRINLYIFNCFVLILHPVASFWKIERYKLSALAVTACMHRHQRRDRGSENIPLASICQNAFSIC